jgi:hypothetical protein
VDLLSEIGELSIAKCLQFLLFKVCKSPRANSAQLNQIGKGFYVPAYIPLQQVCGTGVGDVECWRVLAAYSSTL